MEMTLAAETTVTELPDLILPVEILDYILAQLDLRSLLAASRVNKKLNSVVRIDTGLAARTLRILRHPTLLQFYATASQPNLVFGNHQQLMNIYRQFTTEILDAVPELGVFQQYMLSTWAQSSSAFTATGDGHDLVHTVLSTNDQLSAEITLGDFRCTLRDAFFLRACMSTFIYHNGGASYLTKVIKLVGSKFF